MLIAIPDVLDAADHGHPDVEHDGGELAAEQCHQSLVRGLGADEPVVGRTEDALEHVEVARLVVDEEDADPAALLARGPVVAVQR